MRFTRTSRLILGAALAAAGFCAAPAQAAKKSPSTKPAALTPEEQEAKYSQAISKRADDILAALDLKDSAKAARVKDIIVNQYRALRDWHDANDARIKALAKEPGSDEAKQIAASRKVLHDQFLSQLSAELTPEQIETVKDKMTYNKVEVTYKAYTQIVPDLSEQDKAKILEFLKQAREEAIDGGSAEEKSTIFKQYKGKINNYLDSTGHNVSKAYKDWGQKQKHANAPATEPAE